MIISLKMAALCLNTSLETLWQLCCRHTLHLQGDLSRLLWHFLHTISSETAHSLLSRFWGLHSPKANSRRWWSVLRSHSWVVLIFWAGTDSCWKTHSWPLKKVTLRCFTTPCNTSSWYTRTSVSPLSCKKEDVTELMPRPSICMVSQKCLMVFEMK